jgi:hypothetical protein
LILTTFPHPTSGDEWPINTPLGSIYKLIEWSRVTKQNVLLLKIPYV